VLSRIVSGLILASITAGVTLAQTPVITPTGTVNAATFENGKPVSPGGLISIFGSQLAAGVALAQSVPLSTSLNGTSVTINGVAAPLNFVSAGQINAQMPFEVLPAGVSGAVNVVVTRNGVSSAPDPVVIGQFGPGIYSNGGHALAQIVSDPNDSARYLKLAVKPGTFPALTTASARPGDFLQIYTTGLGPLDVPVRSGDAGYPPLRNTTSTPVVLLNGTTPADVKFSGMSPEFVGVYQVNVQLPPNAPLGDAVPIQIQIGGVTSPASVTISIAAQ
jgi:uncharacterized protein (TIGR03437 family)